MRLFIGLLCASAVLGCGAGDGPVAHEVYAPSSLPWDGQQWETDIVIEGPAEDQDAVRSFIFHLRKNFGLSPYGSSEKVYGGHMFWDADVWVFPALAMIDPSLARQIPEERLRTAKTAQIETLLTYGDRYLDPVALLERSRPDLVIRTLPLRFPHESDGGKDATPDATKKEEHASGGVAWSLRFASDLGMFDWGRVEPVGQAIARHYLRRSFDGLHGLEIRDVVSVDEWIEGDNCLYTNAAADLSVRSFLGRDAGFHFPRDDAGKLVAYAGDPVRAYQQAAAPLLLWPLEREDLVEDPIEFLERFEGKESQNGPAMSLSVYALIRARYGDADAALRTWRESWRRYVDAEWQFMERPGRPELTYFVTGAAGCLNAVIYGFLGARVVAEPKEGDAKIELANGRWLVFRPNLPSEWKRATFKGVRVRGAIYDVVCEGRKATVTSRIKVD